jgi:hypothetical protein
VNYLSRGLATSLGFLCACESYMAGNREHTRVRNECVRSHDSSERGVSPNKRDTLNQDRTDYGGVLC